MEELGPAPRSLDRFAHSVAGRRAHGGHRPHHPRPAARSRSASQGSSRPTSPTGLHMSEDRSGRELTPRDASPEGGDSALTPVPEADDRAVERFSAGPQAHTVGLTEERAPRSSGRAATPATSSSSRSSSSRSSSRSTGSTRSASPPSGAEGRLAHEKDVQYVTDVERGLRALPGQLRDAATATTAQGGIGPPLNDQAKLYNALTDNGEPGHRPPQPELHHDGAGGRRPLRLRRPQQPHASRGANPTARSTTARSRSSSPGSRRATTSRSSTSRRPTRPGLPRRAGPRGSRHRPGWRDPNWTPAPGRSPPPACWRNPSGQIGGARRHDRRRPAGPIRAWHRRRPARSSPWRRPRSLTITDRRRGATCQQIASIPGETVAIDVDNTAGFDHNFYIGSQAELEVPNATTDVGIAAWTEGVQS